MAEGMGVVTTEGCELEVVGTHHPAQEGFNF